MNITPLSIPDVVLIQPTLFRDNRGFFLERFHEKKFKDAGLPHSFIQDNYSRSIPGVLRGLHYQLNPDQGKLVGVTRGKIWDVAVDIRKNSPTFGKYVAHELDAENQNQLWIPGGFAHGFYVLGDEPADVLYKVTEFYNPAKESAIVWNDPELKIQWPLKSPPLLSPKDEKAQSFAEYREKGNPTKAQ